MTASGTYPFLLPPEPRVDSTILRKVTADYENPTRRPSQNLESYILENYAIDLSTRYGTLLIKNPFGKASGQLSLQASQVEADALAGLGFCVLKTVIGQDESGDQSMVAWAIKESRMVVERIRHEPTHREGWTVTWKGRGWWGTFQAYLDLIRDALTVARPHNMLVVPSCKYHLPTPDSPQWKTSEYDYTTRRFLETWQAHNPGRPFILEKDFSPTLAGSNLAAQQAQILEWLNTSPVLIRRAVAPHPVLVGLKLFNALFDDDFQLRMLDAVHAAVGPPRPDFLIYANRLFDPNKEFDGHKGVAYGGPALSARNLSVLTQFRTRHRHAIPLIPPPPSEPPLSEPEAQARDTSEPEARTRDALPTSLPSEPEAPAMDLHLATILNPQSPNKSAIRNPQSAIEAPLPISATGDISSGRLAVEYLLRGCENFQMHTLFQLPDSEFKMTTGSKSRKVLHELLFHPSEGFLVWLHHVAGAHDLKSAGLISLQTLARFHDHPVCPYFNP